MSTKILIETLNIGIKNNHIDAVCFKIPASAKTAMITTKNRYAAAPVILSRKNILESQPRYILVNSGNANACTGKTGASNSLKCTNLISQKFNCKSSQVLLFSTGIIGRQLPIEKIEKKLNSHKFSFTSSWKSASKAIMTTDTIPKAVSKSIIIQNQKVTITGISKGSGMIYPNMATMLAFISTDANISLEILQKLNREITDTTFNCISVDGDTSTNDSFIIAATNQSKHSKINKEDSNYKVLKSAIFDVSLELAQAIIRDGEGATKFITIEVLGGNNEARCKEVGMSVAKSPLVKTAFFASDPNLGRILAAVGNSNLKDLNISIIDLYINEIIFAREGAIAKDFDELKIQKEMKNSEICVKINLNEGTHKATVWTTDLSYEYVKINAEYRT